ncbi:MAG TPA: POTRA domain-containing protein, partial [Pyrinomonadaceae bacterium]
MSIRRFFFILPALAVFLAAATVFAASRAELQTGDYEGRIITSVQVVIEGTPRDAAAEAEFATLLRVAPGSEYSAVRVRESLQALFDSGLIANARVEAGENCAPAPGTQPGRPLCVRFIVQRQLRVGDVRLSLNIAPGSPLSEDELRTRLNMLEPGARLSEQTLKNNADLIQAYLRDRGFYRAEVSFTQVRDAADPTGTRMTVVYTINPGEQALVA